MQELNDDSVVLHQQALANYKKGFFLLAEQQFIELLHRYPDQIDILYNLALALKAQEKVTEAVASLLAILEINPNHIRANFLLGKFLLEKDLPEDAEKYLAIAAEEQPNNVDIQKNIFLCLLNYRQLIPAKYYAEKILTLEPTNLEIRYNLALICYQLRQIGQAVLHYHEILLSNPHYFPALNNLATLYLEQNDLPKAIHYAKQALTQQPDNVALRYTLEAIQGKNLYTAPPKEYIQQLFDQYAEHYEKHLLIALEYQVPLQLRQALNHCFSFSEKSLVVLDVGCGTGLSGSAFQDLAKTLIGIDLSANMLAEAEKKQIYSQLILDDFVKYLSNIHAQFDLIIAADVLVYLGDLDNFIYYAKQALIQKGILLFSVELNEFETFSQEKSGRFSHGKAYIEQLCNKYNLSIHHFAIVPTRIQHNTMVNGAVFVISSKY